MICSCRTRTPSRCPNEIRKQPSGRYIPILLLSSLRPGGDDLRPLPPGTAISIHKPIRPAQLLEALCRALSVQLQRDKKAPAAPMLDADLSRRLPLRLLLADDNPINQKVGLSVLHKLGYHADVANNGLEVLKALEQKAYDILFLDVQMPEMDGLEAARQICQKWSADKRPRIIAMTGNALIGDREKCLQAGMDDYISKPVRVAELAIRARALGPDQGPKVRHRIPCARQACRARTTCSTRPSSPTCAALPPSDGVGMLRGTGGPLPRKRAAAHGPDQPVH